VPSRSYFLTEKLGGQRFLFLDGNLSRRRNFTNIFSVQKVSYGCIFNLQASQEAFGMRNRPPSESGMTCSRLRSDFSSPQ
jgi:hypothetical protein